MDDTTKILIIEDSKAYAKSLQRMIEMSERMDHIATFTSAEAFIDCLDDRRFQEIDIILLDLQLPGKNGFQLIPTLQQVIPEGNILILTHNDDYHETLEAIRLGVSGYILKDSGIATLRNAIQEVHEGGCVIDAQLSKIVLKILTSGEQAEEDNVLSRREQQVLELMAAGLVKKEVADRLDLSYRTVAQYTESIYKKLQVPNIAAAVATAIRKGII